MCSKPLWILRDPEVRLASSVHVHICLCELTHVVQVQALVQARVTLTALRGPFSPTGSCTLIFATSLEDLIHLKKSYNCIFSIIRYLITRLNVLNQAACVNNDDLVSHALLLGFQEAHQAAHRMWKVIFSFLHRVWQAGAAEPMSGVSRWGEGGGRGLLLSAISAQRLRMRLLDEGFSVRIIFQGQWGFSKRHA